MNHRLMTREKQHTHILTKQITGVALLGDGPQLIGAPGIVLVIIPSKLHHLKREKMKDWQRLFFFYFYFFITIQLKPKRNVCSNQP